MKQKTQIPAIYTRANKLNLQKSFMILIRIRKATEKEGWM